MPKRIQEKKYRSDYAPFPYLIDQINLYFELHPDRTFVTNIMHVRRKREVPSKNSFVLNGEDLDIHELYVDGKPHSSNIINGALTLDNLPDCFTLKIKSSCSPKKNTSLNGLYMSRGAFFTQCEAEGFRRITYFPDRPDVLSIYTVTIKANKHHFPILLSNGNLLEEIDLDDKFHCVKWFDPFPKPSYLFALVAGDFISREKTIKISNNAEKILQIWVRRDDLPKTKHAMNALIKAIFWDEERFGLSLDLERFMIVAVDDFNMGAMENKGLNIFNTKCVLAHPDIATDEDFARVEEVIAHEYLHNWTGNRVTCRDWFELTLKEGLTVFRDQEFTADQIAKFIENKESGLAIKRIQDVRFLRENQFAEDAGPLAHSVRPENYIEINNLYTSTVYEKGAEIVRMYKVLFGIDGFKQGLDLYFLRHDGQAITCDDFYMAMVDANGRAIDNFKHWYSQIGTPRIAVTTNYNPCSKLYTISLRQKAPVSEIRGGGNVLLDSSNVLHIPFALGLLNSDGVDLDLMSDDKNVNQKIKKEIFGRVEKTVVLELTCVEQTFEFKNVDFLRSSSQKKFLDDVSQLSLNLEPTFSKVQPPHEPIPSLLRDFSAPVIVEYDYSDDELYFLLLHDVDAFNRWNAAQELYVRVVKHCIECFRVNSGSFPSIPEHMLFALSKVLTDQSLSPAYINFVLTLPTENVVADQVDNADPYLIHKAWIYLKHYLAEYFRGYWEELYYKFRISTPYCFDYKFMASRALANLSLSYLSEINDGKYFNIAREHYEVADNLTDRICSLTALLRQDGVRAQYFLDDFYVNYKNEALAIDKWFSLQALRTDLPDNSTALSVRHLTKHLDFDQTNPNRVRSLISTFCIHNPSSFYEKNGYGYEVLSDQIRLLDEVNPQLAASLAKLFSRWRCYTPFIKESIRDVLQNLSDQVRSKDVCEIIDNLLSASH